MVSTKKHFDLWWKRENKKPILCLYYPNIKLKHENIDQYTDIKTNIKNVTTEHLRNNFNSDRFPDISSYLGPGSLATFLGAIPIYSDDTIWYQETTNKLEDIYKYFKNPTKWYKWSLDATKAYAKNINQFRTSIPDLQQNLDIISALISPIQLMYDLIDKKEEVLNVLEQLYLFWEKTFFEHAKHIIDDEGYTSFGFYNIIGKGFTSVLQSDISIMMSCDMFDYFEAPFLKKQCEKLDNVLYHLDGEGAIRHLDTLLSIDKINAIQWVPGAGQPNSSDEKWYSLYEKILKSGKGLYVYLKKEKVESFLERFGTKGIFIGTTVNNVYEELNLIDKINNKY